MSYPHTIAASIVTYNNPPEQIIRTIQSYLKSPLATKLTVVDNASDNNLVEILQSYSNWDKSKLSFIQNTENIGFGRAHNMAIAAAKDAYFYLILNPDVLIHDQALEILAGYLEQYPEVGLVTPKILNEDGTLQHLNKRPPTVLDMALRRFVPSLLQNLWPIKPRTDYFTMEDVGYDNPVEVPYCSGCFMFYRNSVLQQLAGFDEQIFMYMEDADLSKRTHALSKVMYVPDAHITHLWQRGSHKSWKLTYENIKAAMYYFNKWGWKWW